MRHRILRAAARVGRWAVSRYTLANGIPEVSETGRLSPGVRRGGINREIPSAFPIKVPGMKRIPGLAFVLLLAAAPALRADDSDLAAYLASLKDHQAFVRAAAALDLGNRGPKATNAVPALVEALADPDGGVRGRAADALAQINARPELAVPALVKLLGSGEASDRVAAADALARFPQSHAAAVPALTRALADPEALVRWRAVDALRSF